MRLQPLKLSVFHLNKIGINQTTFTTPRMIMMWQEETNIYGYFCALHLAEIKIMPQATYNDHFLVASATVNIHYVIFLG